MLWWRFVVRSGRRYLHYLVQEDTDSANKRNHDVINGNVLRHNYALPMLFFPSVMIALAWLSPW